MTLNFWIGVFVGSLVFIFIDPVVTAPEVDKAQQICVDHGGLRLIKTNIFSNYVSGVCSDGLSFTQDNVPIQSLK